MQVEGRRMVVRAGQAIATDENPIRDPASAGAAIMSRRDGPARAPIYDIRDFAAFGRSLYRHMPVSYTHLTLPTKA